MGMLTWYYSLSLVFWVVQAVGPFSLELFFVFPAAVLLQVQVFLFLSAYVDVLMGRLHSIEMTRFLSDPGCRSNCLRFDRFHSLESKLPVGFQFVTSMIEEWRVGALIFCYELSSIEVTCYSFQHIQRFKTSKGTAQVILKLSLQEKKHIVYIEEERHRLRIT